MDNTGDRKSIRAKEKDAALADRRREDVLRNVMSTIEGRAWLWDLLASCNCFSTTFTGDPQRSAFLEGQRAIGLSILSDITTACPDQYIQAQRESNERRITAEQRSRQIADGRDFGSIDDNDPNHNTRYDHFDRPDLYRTDN
jgi:hypothetical protein